MRALASRLKVRALGSMKASGLFDVVRDSQWRRQRLLILCYHGISIEDEHEWSPTLYMSLEQFESRLDMLRTHRYSVLPLGEALTAVRRGALPPRSVSITFDDGMHDFYVRAFPALESRGMPVTTYLTTSYCEENRPVYTLICSYLLWKARNRTWSAASVLGLDATFDLRTDQGRQAAWSLLMQTAVRGDYSNAEKHAVVERLAGALHLDLDAIMAARMLHVMNPGAVEALSARGVDFQLHTHHHHSPLDAALFRQEIQDNRVRIERLTNTRPAHFCYPSGEYRPEFLPWLEQEEVVSATTCDPGIVTRRSSPLLLPRFVDTSSVPPVVFEGWLTGVASWFSRRRANAHA